MGYHSPLPLVAIVVGLIGCEQESQEQEKKSNDLKAECTCDSQRVVPMFGQIFFITNSEKNMII